MPRNQYTFTKGSPRPAQAAAKSNAVQAVKRAAAKTILPPGPSAPAPPRIPAAPPLPKPPPAPPGPSWNAGHVYEQLRRLVAEAKAKAIAKGYSPGKHGKHPRAGRDHYFAAGAFLLRNGAIIYTTISGYYDDDVHIQAALWSSEPDVDSGAVLDFLMYSEQH